MYKRQKLCLVCFFLGFLYILLFIISAIWKSYNSMSMYWDKRSKTVSFPMTGLKTILSTNDMCDSMPYLVVLVPTQHKSVEERHSIRKTWMNPVWANLNRNYTVKLIFVVGTSLNRIDDLIIKDEHEQYKDILEGDFMESYTNLTLKILFGLNWINKFCDSAQYVLKADDDTLIILPNLLRFLSQTRLKTRIIGHIVEGEEVKRKGRWKVDSNLYPHKIYPPYVFGNSYVIPINIIEHLVTASNYIPMITVEDAYITGILRREAHSGLIHHPGFALRLHSIKVFNLCLYRDKISITNLGPLKLLEMWSSIVHFNHSDC